MKTNLIEKVVKAKLPKEGDTSKKKEGGRMDKGRRRKPAMVPFHLVF
jgi:hypothetical protein